ncbi:Uncharacterized protein BP5553_07573 [Venustampulla echinocandica]|uniref:Fe2OG dioxygenase domain-containing protein n=1 Tax=Venustampulla echinocandica TaxID=2656787 RepID=A0A370TGW8_9HELO|nr:Uncharacterized protein BP5553_07573 [Venustampulla echinocandica]RDL34445.1 Uncharacterized protein BP5553_07573 [Venustampulla echinocandica]
MVNWGYAIALLPIYVFIWLPISHILFGAAKNPADARYRTLNSSLIASNDPLPCISHSYYTFILSQEPLIIYIENFLSSQESDHLLQISEDKFAPSTVSTGPETSIKRDIRLSEVALIDRDEIVRCIEHRARAFQGWRPELHIERLRTQRYGVGGHYGDHYDWSGASREADRVSTFMVYVKADCDGGGTKFPRIKMPFVGNNTRWCEFLECGKQEGGIGTGEDWGVTFKPIGGNAIFWENLRSDGSGYEETIHAALPVVSGTKVGLNIWSWGPARRK